VSIQAERIVGLVDPAPEDIRTLMVSDLPADVPAVEPRMQGMYM
jgi:hypothetical protein